jgi:hypothetical protein
LGFTVKIVAKLRSRETLALSVKYFASMRALWACAFVFGAAVGYMHYDSVFQPAGFEALVVGIAGAIWVLLCSVFVPALLLAVVVPLEPPRTFTFLESGLEVASPRKTIEIPYSSVRSVYFSSAGLAFRARSVMALLPPRVFPDLVSMQEVVVLLSSATSRR